MPASVKADQGIRATLDAAGMRVQQQFYEYLDVMRNPGVEHRHELVDLLLLR